MIDLKKIFVISKFTSVEIIKSKILYNILFLGIGLVAVTFVAHQFTYGAPQRVAIDFGLGSLSISSIGIAIFFGANLLKKEMDSRTIYMIISRPVSRVEFILGKLLGLIAVLALNILILAALSLSVYLFSGGEFESLIGWQIFYTFLEAIIVLLVITLFSLVTNQVLSVLFTIFVYISGYALYEVSSFTFVLNRPWLAQLIKAYDFVLPGFYRFNLKDHILYKESVHFESVIATLGYGVLYSCALLIIISIIFNRKSLD